MEVSHWLKEGSSGPHSFIFMATVWWAWRHHNLMCLSNENWSLSRLFYNIYSMVDSFISCFKINAHADHVERFIRWNNDNYSCTIINVDGSFLGNPVRAGFGGIMWNHAWFYLSGFSGYINDSSDIMYVELFTIYQGLVLAKSLNISDLVCYIDSLRCINLLKGPTMRYHVYVVLIQDVKDTIRQDNVALCPTLREENQCVDFMAKFGAGLDTKLLYHASPPEDLLYLLRMDTAGTLYSI